MIGSKIKIAIVGVGNCASALIQGIEYYRNGNPQEAVGLMHREIGDYRPEDIEVVAAFDIDQRKVSRDLSEAIFAPPNCTKVFFPQVPHKGITVQMGHILDGYSDHMKEFPRDQVFVPSDMPPCDVVSELKKSGAEILVNYLPVGSEQAARFYAECCLQARVALINCIPVFIASNSQWEARFREAGLPIVGDDVKSQLGATITHRVLTKLFSDRGVKIDRTYQLNTGGNTDFLNMLNRSRLKSKKVSKTEAVQSQLEIPLDAQNIHIGPSDYVPWQKDNKVAFIRMEGRIFGDIPIELELRLSVEDSPNSGGVTIDAIRCCKLALNRGIAGALQGVSSYFMKHPPRQFSDEQARDKVERFISGQSDSL